ncbi:MAG: transglutaminase family protein cysteine peptidase [Hyphomicrobiales bacterium]|jgi:predicted transglutaminase-like cysteine proteinase|nr:transglutaminase family protein cysteine peptidase [Hyphomicrobiales bacterium]
MLRAFARLTIAVGLLTGGWAGFHASSQASALQGTFISVGGQTLVPYGWVDFCARYAGECDGGPMQPLDINATPKALKLIDKINGWVNSNITAKSDLEQWGSVDRWDYPTNGFGDCEDYVLLKRKMLIEEGFPRQALLVTVVKDEQGEGHAVLTVKTSKGEFVLDNLNDDVKRWDRTPYRFVKRQSQQDPRIWVNIGAPTSAPQMVSR